jgi:hypothetical protein
MSADGFCSARRANLSQACAMPISNILSSGLMVALSAMDKHSKA